MAVFPFSEAGKYAYENEWRLLFTHIGDGVVGDRTGTGLKVTATGADRTVTMSVGTAKVQGFGYTTASTVSLNAGTTGTQPTGTQVRTDVFVLRLDVSAKTITPMLVTGTPGAAAARPTLQTSATGLFDLPLASWTKGTTAITNANIVDERSWLGPHYTFPDNAVLPTTAMVGSSAYWRGFRYNRILDISANPSWVPAKESTGRLAFANGTTVTTGTDAAIPGAAMTFTLSTTRIVKVEGTSGVNCTTTRALADIYTSASGGTWSIISGRYAADVGVAATEIARGVIIATSYATLTPGTYTVTPRLRLRAGGGTCTSTGSFWEVIDHGPG